MCASGRVRDHCVRRTRGTSPAAHELVEEFASEPVGANTLDAVTSPGSAHGGKYPYRGGEQGSWVRPSLEGCDENKYATAVGEEGDVIHFRHRTDPASDVIVDFAVILEAQIGTYRQNIAEIDICHGSLHIHFYDSQGQKLPAHESFRPVNTQDDVQASYDQAVDLITDNWGHYKEGWRREHARS
jgi:hypothetical protein